MIGAFQAGVFSNISGGAYVTQARDFDGTNDYATLGATPTGITDGKLITCSFWFRDGRATQTGTLFVVTLAAGASIRFSVRFIGTSLFLTAANASGVSILQASKTLPTLDGLWHHAHIAIDLASTSNRKMAIDNVSTGVTWSTYSNQVMDLDGGQCVIGADASVGSRFNGCLSELWLNDEYQPDTAKFYVSGKPISLGTTGAVPTGNQPAIYMPYGDPADNKGTGGNFTVTGTLDVCSTSPTD